MRILTILLIMFFCIGSFYEAGAESTPYIVERKSIDNGAVQYYVLDPISEAEQEGWEIVPTEYVTEEGSYKIINSEQLKEVGL